MQNQAMNLTTNDTKPLLMSRTRTCFNILALFPLNLSLQAEFFFVKDKDIKVSVRVRKVSEQVFHTFQTPSCSWQNFMTVITAISGVPLSTGTL